MRFATIFPVVEWAQKWINQWTEIPPEVQQDLVFLMESKALIAQLANLQNTVSALCSILKIEGYSLANKEELLAILAKEKHPIFSHKVAGYIERLEEKRSLLKRENMVCCSDIIASFFGKFNRIADADESSQ